MKRPTYHRSGDFRDLGRKSGQALLESLGVIILLCLILFATVQYIMMLTATEIIQHSANTSVRARTVGLNRFMVTKVTTLASIPVSGAMSQPNYSTYTPPNSHTWNNNPINTAGNVVDNQIWRRPNRNRFYFERLFFRPYLESEHSGIAPGILEYDRSPRFDGRVPEYGVSSPRYLNSGDMIGVRVEQEYPLTMPFYQAFSSNDFIEVRREAWLADHSEFYLQ